MQKKIILLTCVKEKRKLKSKAVDLYQGALFRKLLKFAYDQKPDELFILSGKYGLLNLDTEIEPYDLNLNHKTKAEQITWSVKVLEKLALKADLKNDYFILLTNEVYRKYLVKEMNHYEVPFYIV